VVSISNRFVVAWPAAAASGRPLGLELGSSLIGRDATVSLVAVDDPTEDQANSSEGGGDQQDRPEPVRDSSRRSGSKRSSDPDGDAKLPIKMLNDRILVQIEGPDGERKSSGGILIPATAQVGKRLAWAEVVAVGPSVRTMELGDRVLFNPEDRYEVEVGGSDYIILRERDIHAVAATRLDASHTGLYL